MANYDQRKNDNKKSAPSKDGEHKNSDRRENSKSQGHPEQKAKKDNERT